jgi:hypothetical protein
MGTYTHEQWTTMVMHASTLPRDKAAQVADLLVKEPHHGVWHAASIVFKSPCWCARCRPDVRRFA